MSKKLNKKVVENRFLNRRQFLVGSGATMLALPPLLSLMSRPAFAQAVNGKRVRAVAYVAQYGIDPDRFFPALNTPGMIPFAGAYSTKYRMLNSFASPISRVFDSSFTSMLPHMNILRGLSMTGGKYMGHNNSVLAGTHNANRNYPLGRTIDVVMEKSSGVYGPGSYVPHKAVRIYSGKGEIAFSYDASGGTRLVSNGYQGDRAMFNGLLATLTGSAPVTGSQAGVNNQKIVDQVQVDLNALLSSRALSSEDRQLLNRYIASIDDLETRIAASSGGTQPVCTSPNLNFQVKTSGSASAFPSGGWGITNNSLLFDNYIEMLKIAFMCDLTRVAFIGNAIWEDAPNDPETFSGGLHHTCPGVDAAADRQAYGIKKMLKLAQALQSVADPYDPGSTLLKNSIILATNELGSWYQDHNVFCMPAVTFGQGGGLIKTGYYVDYTQTPYIDLFGGTQTFYPGRPYKQLLQTVMAAAGVPKSEYVSYGDGKGFGEFVEGVNQFGKVRPTLYTPYKNEHNDLLPVIT